jgi:Zn-dependent membrane protease YugP
MFIYYGYFNYLIFMLPAIIISLAAQIGVKSTFAKYNKVKNFRNITGAEAARRVIQYGGVTNVTIQPIAGNLSDNFDPTTNTINLSEDVYNNTSVAALGVAAHEAGHALQYADAYKPLKLRSAMVPVTRISSTMSFPIILFGYFLSVQPLIIAGIVLFSFAVLFSIITLPVEFNASGRAIKILGDAGVLQEEELKGAKRVLIAAAMTYLSATFTALWQLLRLILIFGGRGRE